MNSLNEILSQLGIHSQNEVHMNLPPVKLVEKALEKKEGVLAENGALSVLTGRYTGRSPMDRFIVDSDLTHDTINWGDANQPMQEETFWRIYDRLVSYLQDKELFVFRGYCGHDPEYRMPLTVINQFAWQNLFAHQLFVCPTEEELANMEDDGFTVICAPGFSAYTQTDGTRSEAFVILNLKERMVIIGGTQYAGEIKKSIFTAMNYFLPEKNVTPMHCSANVNELGQTTLFFGLSGTGKTTLSADPLCRLIGDDEHGWTDHGVFNFEGGCYAKCIRLSQENEPQIWNALKFGSVMENVVLDKQRKPDFDSDHYTENTRGAYPLEYIPGVMDNGMGAPPKTVIFLTADAFGVLPPVAKLSPEQAMYYFLSGYTSKLAGTEIGIKEPQTTFSTGFGEPFLPRPAKIYAELLREKIVKHNTNVYMINTGWSGGPYGVGSRISIAHTRAIVRAAITGKLEDTIFEPQPIFGIGMPESCPGVPDEILNPRNTWEDKAAYDATLRKLAEAFVKNFSRYEADMPEVKAAGPAL